ncbi:cobalamin (vitamin B12) biosynthesis CbiG protein [Methanothrix thermoacetophila PT]|uniref:Cobalamin (Vitamin B12) biosynthesis CbiG protein n=2 Tax=Methanothrix TaxID=2222 RepID=A0B5H1_METTP|nr:cobalamin (vitamin B12) biosynthesis CbiG protein [Methanothrix thermoacetophila PT]
MEELFREYDMILALMAVGIVVRQVCPLLRDKWTDKPVVAVDSALKTAVPVIGGHHGANDLALYLFKHLGIYPAITTATDSSGRPNLEGIASAFGSEIVNRDASKHINASFLYQDVPIVRLRGPRIVIVDKDVAVLKSSGLIAGLGARKGATADEILSAVRSATAEAGRDVSEVRVIATSEIKSCDPEISRAAAKLGVSVVYLPDDALNAQKPLTPSRASMLGLSGVAEPAVLALAQRMILPKKVYGRVTVALGE